MRKQTPESFWLKVDIKAPTECWLWTGAKLPKGYGRIKYGGKDRLVHRLAAYLHSIIPTLEAESLVLHSCDTPLCCNPAHLRAGTQTDNMRDMLERARGNQPKGEANGNAKLTATQVAEIRERHAAGGIIQRELGLEFGVSRELVSHIVNNRTWRN